MFLCVFDMFCLHFRGKMYLSGEIFSLCLKRYATWDCVIIKNSRIEELTHQDDCRRLLCERFGFFGETRHGVRKYPIFSARKEYVARNASNDVTHETSNDICLWQMIYSHSLNANIVS